MSKIIGVKAREILDARGTPTIEVTIWLDNNLLAISSVPCSIHSSKYEAAILRDNDPDRAGGLGVLKSVAIINQTIAPQLINLDPTKQRDIDQILVNLDGTTNKTNFGSNTLLAISQAILKAGAISVSMPLYYYLQQKYKLTDNLFMPHCIYGLINGGEYGSGSLDLQEYQVIPASHLDYKTSLFMVVSLQKKMEEFLSSSESQAATGSIGGFTPNLVNNMEPFNLIIQTIKNTPFALSKDIFLGLDANASHFFQGGKYILKDRQQPYSSTELKEYYKDLKSAYKITYIEDPFAIDDFNGWQTLYRDIAETSIIAGDNLISTNKARLQMAIKEKLCNAVVVKPSQVGTISETVEIIKMAKDAGWQVVIAHRGSDTNDTLIADLAVGTGADFAKFGPPNRGERVEKYNRLLEIFEQLNS